MQLSIGLRAQRSDMDTTARDPKEASIAVAVPVAAATTAAGSPPITSLYSTGASPVPIPVSAVAKVFNLPELLEKILIHVANFTRYGFTVKKSAAVTGRRTYRPPSKQLFVLQRINSNFQATIRGSQTLQRRMFLTASPASANDGISSELIGTSFQDSFQWFLAMVGIKAQDHRELYGRPDKLVIESHPHTSGNLSSSRDASWRDMKLHCTKGRGPFTIKFRTNKGTIFPVRVFEEEEEMTLGRLHNGLKELMPWFKNFDRIQTYVHSFDRHEGDVRFPKLPFPQYTRGGMETAGERLQEVCAREDLWE